MNNARFTVPEGEIIQCRRHIHEHPELSFKEFDTANITGTYFPVEGGYLAR